MPGAKEENLDSHGYLRGGQVPPDFNRILQPKGPSVPLSPVYRDLYSIGAVFVTTNYDTWLDEEAGRTSPTLGAIEDGPEPEQQAIGIQSRQPGQVFFRRADLTVEKLALPGSVIHLHGSLKDTGTMVLTTRKYLDHYGADTVRDFLDELFLRYTVLFVGYGLEEEEILSHIMRGGYPEKVREKEKRHYRLFPTFSYQNALFDYLSRYYLNHCNVELVGFCTDKQGDSLLEKVVTEWAWQIRRHLQPPKFLEKRKIIDGALDEET